MNERRQGERVPYHDFVTAIFGGRAALCFGADLSERGLFVRSVGTVLRRLEAHEGPVILRFDLPGDRKPTMAYGRVRRAGVSNDGRGTAIEFTWLPPDAREALAAA